MSSTEIAGQVRDHRRRVWRAALVRVISGGQSRVYISVAGLDTPNLGEIRLEAKCDRAAAEAIRDRRAADLSCERFDAQRLKWRQAALSVSPGADDVVIAAAFIDAGKMTSDSLTIHLDSGEDQRFAACILDRVDRRERGDGVRKRKEIAA